MKKIIALILSVNFIFAAASADVLKDFDGLGENKDLFDKAKALHPDMKVVVVQERVVKRRNRLEIAPEFAMVTGGDKYINTYSYGANLHFHINPWISVGGRYSYFTNELTSEAESLINDTDANGQGIIPQIDHPKSSLMAVVNIYPIYGKMNTMNLGITHFDLYLTGGYGQIELKSGATPTWTAGGGVGFWFSQHLTSRFEVRYQNYTATRNNSEGSIDSVIAGLQIGYLL